MSALPRLHFLYFTQSQHSRTLSTFFVDVFCNGDGDISPTCAWCLVRSQNAPNTGYCNHVNFEASSVRNEFGGLQWLLQGGIWSSTCTHLTSKLRPSWPSFLGKTSLFTSTSPVHVTGMAPRKNKWCVRVGLERGYFKPLGYARIFVYLHPPPRLNTPTGKYPTRSISHMGLCLLHHRGPLVSIQVRRIPRRAALRLRCCSTLVWIFLESPVEGSDIRLEGAAGVPRDPPRILEYQIYLRRLSLLA